MYVLARKCLIDSQSMACEGELLFDWSFNRQDCCQMYVMNDSRDDELEQTCSIASFHLTWLQLPIQIHSFKLAILPSCPKVSESQAGSTEIPLCCPSVRVCHARLSRHLKLP